MKNALRGLSRESAAVIALFLVLLVALVLRGAPEPAGRPWDLDSAQPGGLLALRTWLDEMGYPVTTTGREGFTIPPDAGLFLVYPGDWPFSAVHALELQRWVESGGTLVVIGADDAQLARTFDVHSSFQAMGGGGSVQVQPLFPAGPAVFRGDSEVAFDAGTLELGDPGAVAVLATGRGAPLAALERMGRGTVWHLSTRHGLTNGELRDGDGAHIVLALLRTVRPGSAAVFDTYHLLGPRSTANPEEVLSLRDWVWHSAPGRGLLFAGAALFLGLLLAGIRLGPPLPAPEDLRRREAAEHVAALAGLLRRARQREAVARHQRGRLKAALARRVHVSVELPDPEFVARWAELDREAAGDAPQVRALLAALAGDPDEAALVRLAAEVDEVIARLRS